MMFGPGGDRGPLDMPTTEEKAAYLKLQRYQKIDEALGAVDNGVLEVEQHIIDRMKAESGACNLKALAEALAIVRPLERRKP